MKKLLSCLIVCGLLSLPAAVRAEDFSGGMSDLGSANARPPIATDAEVAMMYWQLARKTPNFDKMAKQTEAYKKAGQFDRDSVLSAQKADMQNVFDNVNFSKPSVVRLLVNLSPYSEKNKGFVITNMEDQTFFKYSFAGENYAIVPRGLLDHQFMGPINDISFVGKIGSHQRADHNIFHLMIFLKPDYADAPDSMTEIEGQKFHIISGQVSHVALYDMAEDLQLWGDNSSDFNKQQSDELMNLKQ